MMYWLSENPRQRRAVRSAARIENTGSPSISSQARRRPRNGAPDRIIFKNSGIPVDNFTSSGGIFHDRWQGATVLALLSTRAFSRTLSTYKRRRERWNGNNKECGLSQLLDTSHAY